MRISSSPLLCSCHLFVWILMSLLLFPSVLFLDPANLTGKQPPPLSYVHQSLFFFFFFTRLDLCRVRINLFFKLHNNQTNQTNWTLHANTTKPENLIKVTFRIWRSATAALLEFACISRRWSMMMGGCYVKADVPHTSKKKAVGVVHKSCSALFARN